MNFPISRNFARRYHKWRYYTINRRKQSDLFLGKVLESSRRPGKYDEPQRLVGRTTARGRKLYRLPRPQFARYGPQIIFIDISKINLTANKDICVSLQKAKYISWNFTRHLCIFWLYHKEKQRTCQTSEVSLCRRSLYRRIYIQNIISNNLHGFQHIFNIL